MTSTITPPVAPGQPSPEGKPTIERGPFWTMRRKVIAGIAAVAVTGGALFAVKGSGESTDTTPKPKPTETSQVQEPNPVAPEEQPAPVTGVEEGTESLSIDVTEIPENVVEFNLFSSLTAEQQAEISSMDNMSLETFRAQPYEEQLQFAEFVYDNNIDITKYRLDQTGFGYIHEKANTETPEGVFYANQLKSALIASLKTRTEQDGIQYQTLTAQKANALIFNALEDPKAVESSDLGISGLNLNTPVMQNPSKFTSGTTDENGNFVINGVSYTGEVFQAVDIVSTITKIDGTTKTEARQLYTVSTSDPRYRQSLGE